MSLPNYADLINRYPAERSAIAELNRLLSQETRTEMTFEHLVLHLRPTSKESLALILAELARIGAVRRVFRVESRDHGGIQDFDNLQNVPDRIHDWRIDEDVEVTLDNVRVIYVSQ